MPHCLIVGNYGEGPQTKSTGVDQPGENPLLPTLWLPVMLESRSSQTLNGGDWSSTGEQLTYGVNSNSEDCGGQHVNTTLSQSKQGSDCLHHQVEDKRGFCFFRRRTTMIPESNVLRNCKKIKRCIYYSTNHIRHIYQ